MPPAADPRPGTGEYLGELAARIEGAGPPVVLLHGNSEDWSVFDAVIPLLDGFTTISLDSRGHGRSPRGNKALSLRQLAIDTCRAMLEYRARCAGGRPVTFGLIGFSDGANIGLEIAVHRPDLLAAQVLLGGNVTPAALRPLTNAGILVAYWATRVAGAVSAGARHRSQVLGLMVGQPNVTRAQLEAVSVPTMVMVGQRDVVPRRESQRVAQLIPGAEWVELTGQGHMLPRSAPKLVAELASGFLGPRLVGG